MTVDNEPDAPIGPLPLLPWCGDCWDQIADADSDVPEACPDCGGSDTFLI